MGRCRKKQESFWELKADKCRDSIESSEHSESQTGIVQQFKFTQTLFYFLKGKKNIIREGIMTQGNMGSSLLLASLENPVLF